MSTLYDIWEQTFDLSVVTAIVAYSGGDAEPYIKVFLGEHTANVRPQTFIEENRFEQAFAAFKEAWKESRNPQKVDDTQSQLVGQFMAVYEDSVHIPGDERSRTNPGHGYPEHRHEYITCKEFADEALLKQWLADKKQQRKLRLFRCVPITWSETTTLELKV